MFKVGDLVVRVGCNNGNYAQVGQRAHVVSLDECGVKVAYGEVKSEYWCEESTALVSPVSADERVVAEITRLFEEQPSTVDLHNQFRNGLITSVELANKLLHEWEIYKRGLVTQINQI